jgi:hypothetical protein
VEDGVNPVLLLILVALALAIMNLNTEDPFE